MTQLSRLEATMQDNHSGIHFWQPEKVKVGDLVWFYNLQIFKGPFVIESTRIAGYGSNKRTMYILLDIDNRALLQSEKKWLRVPMEIK